MGRDGGVIYRLMVKEDMCEEATPSQHWCLVTQ